MNVYIHICAHMIVDLWFVTGSSIKVILSICPVNVVVCKNAGFTKKRHGSKTISMFIWRQQCSLVLFFFFVPIIIYQQILVSNRANDRIYINSDLSAMLTFPVLCIISEIFIFNEPDISKFDKWDGLKSSSLHF